MKMPQAQSYHVTAPEKSPEKSTHCETGVFVGLIAGTLSIGFILCVALFPQTFAPVYKDPYKNFKPISYEGNLIAYPPYLNPRVHNGRNDTYIFSLPPEDTAKTVKYLQDIFDYYPKEWTKSYSDCWLENPTYNKPCFFHGTWLGEKCTKSKNYGYDEVNGTFSPCVLIRLEQTGEWLPVPEEKESMPKSLLQLYDPQFLNVACYPKRRSDAKKIGKITVQPEKGFSIKYFPVSSFNPDYYILPAVLIHINGIRKGQNVTIECGLVAQNSLLLWNNGIIKLQFVQFN